MRRQEPVRDARGLEVGRTVTGTADREWRYIALIAISIAGSLIAVYLTWLHWGGSDLLCRGVGDCEKVNFSAYSELMGVPISLLGLGMYVTIGSLATLYMKRRELRPVLWLGLFIVTASGTLYSAYLTYIEVFVLHAVCPWCVASAVLVLLSFVLVASLYSSQVSGTNGSVH